MNEQIMEVFVVSTELEIGLGHLLTIPSPWTHSRTVLAILSIILCIDGNYSFCYSD